jgi:hypothetical protein
MRYSGGLGFFVIVLTQKPAAHCMDGTFSPRQGAKGNDVERNSEVV